MSEGRTATGAGARVGSGTIRLVRAWRALPHESRLAAYAAFALFLTLFLPWYQVTLIAQAKTEKLQSASAAITGWGAFSFVEAAVLVVAAGVLTLLFQRAEGRAFHLPGGDGGVITAAGVWTCVLIVWRIFDKQGATTNGPSATSSGVEWGIFAALTAAAFLTYSGSRIRAAHRPEPPLPGEAGAPVGSSAAATTELRPRTPAVGNNASIPATPREARRRASAPHPVPAERPARGPDRPDRLDDPTPVRPRRRIPAGELFERVVPEDPPSVPFGRIPRPEIRASRRTAPREAEAEHSDRAPAAEHIDPVPADEQLTISFGEDATVPHGEDATVPLGEDATMPLGEDATVPLGEDATMPLGEDATLPLDRDERR
jgi:hypothetical protein